MTLPEYIALYGEALVMRWIVTSEARYLKLKEHKPRKVSPNRLLAEFTDEDMAALKERLK